MKIANPTTFRLSPETKAALKALAVEAHIPASTVVVLLIHRAYRRLQRQQKREEKQ